MEKESVKRLIGMMVLLGSILLIGIGSSFVFDTPSTMDILLAIGIKLGVTVFLVWYTAVQGIFAQEEWLFSWKRCLWILMLYGVLCAVNGLGDWVMALEGQEQTANAELIQSVRSALPAWYHWVSAIVVAPVSEEILFRGILPRVIFPKYEKTALLLGALVFGLFHGVSSVSEAIIYMGGGLVFALAYYRNRSVVDSMSLHVLNNALAVLF